MQLHQQIAAICAGIAGLSLVWNVFTPSNPHHDLNVIEMVAILVLSVLSYALDQRAGGTIQVSMLFVAAFIPMAIEDSPYWAAVVTVLGIMLLYAYDGFRTHSFWKLPATFFIIFGAFAIASSYYTPPSLEMWARAFVWTSAVSAFLVIAHLVVRQILKNFQAALLKQNRELVNKNLEILARCSDGSD